MEVMLLDNKINVEVIRKNNKNIYFRFKDDGVLYVTCNMFVLKRLNLYIYIISNYH